jgi:hypothetical protein
MSQLVLMKLLALLLAPTWSSTMRFASTWLRMLLLAEAQSSTLHFVPTPAPPALLLVPI